MRRLLHLYPGEVQARRELLLKQRAWLAERGVALLLADDWIAPSDRELYAECVQIPPAEAVGATLARLLRFARGHRLDGILAQSEAAAAAGSLLGARLGLPGPRPEAALRCVSKLLTRKVLREQQVPQPEFALARSAREVQAFADQQGYPVLLKACASTMARLVTKLDRPRDVAPAVARMRAGIRRSRDVRRLAEFAAAARLDLDVDPRHAFLVESFAPGAPVETDGLVVRGRARAFGVIEQAMTPPPRFYVEAYLLPSDRPAAARQRIERTGERAAEALGLDQTGFSIELRATRDTARVIEVNGRLGEDRGLWRLFERATGADPFRMAVELALDGAPGFGRSRRRHALAYRCSFAEGVVRRLPDAAEFAALGVEASACVRVGDRMHAPPHPETFPHIAWALASHPSSSRAAHRAARAALRRLSPIVIRTMRRA